jgi:hypothetical protein
MQTRAGGRGAHESEPVRMLYLLAFSLDVEELLLPISPSWMPPSFSRRDDAPCAQRQPQPGYLPRDDAPDGAFSKFRALIPHANNTILAQNVLCPSIFATARFPGSRGQEEEFQRARLSRAKAEFLFSKALGHTRETLK